MVGSSAQVEHDTRRYADEPDDIRRGASFAGNGRGDESRIFATTHRLKPASRWSARQGWWRGCWWPFCVAHCFASVRWC